MAQSQCECLVLHMYIVFMAYVEYDIELISSFTLSLFSSQTYDSWKDKWLRFQDTLPEFSWLKELKESLPDLSNTFAGGTVNY